MKKLINMKKVATWLLLISLLIFVIDWGVMGLKLFDGNYDIIIEAYIGLICFVTMLICILIRSFSTKCPYCGKIRVSNGRYCPHCGKEL